MIDPHDPIRLMTERDLDRLLAAERHRLDASLAAAGVAARLRRETLSRVAHPFAGLDWRRVAAAVLAAGVLGGALDLVVVDPQPETPELVMLDPLADADGSGLP